MKRKGSNKTFTQTGMVPPKPKTGKGETMKVRKGSINNKRGRDERLAGAKL